MTGLKDTVDGDLFKTPFFNPPQIFVEIEVEDPLSPGLFLSFTRISLT